MTRGAKSKRPAVRVRLKADMADSGMERPQGEQKSENLAGDTPIEGEVLSPQDEALVRAVVTRITRSESHSGPLPHPNILRGYAELIPDGVERVMRMAEKQQDHEHKMDGQRETTARFGIVGAFVGMFLGFGTTAFALHMGQGAAAGVIATGTIAGLAGAFIYGTKTQHAEQLEIIKRLPPTKKSDTEDEARI